MSIGRKGRTVLYISSSLEAFAMGKLLLVALFIVLSVSSAMAVDYTVTTTTPERDVGLTWVVGKHNAENGTTLTNQQYLQMLLDQACDSYLVQIGNESVKVGQEMWPNLDPADQAAICAAYAKVGKPLPVCP